MMADTFSFSSQIRAETASRSSKRRIARPAGRTSQKKARRMMAGFS